MTVVALPWLHSVVMEILEDRGLVPPDAELVAEDLISADLEGIPTHGVGRLVLLDQALAARQGRPTVVTSKGAVEAIDANRELGVLAVSYAVERAKALTTSFGVSVVTLRNFSRFGRLARIGSSLAEASLVGIVMTNAGPSAVAPFGGMDPVYGTNPLCLAFPARPDPVVIDFATSAAPWGAIRHAMLAGSALPDGAFLDAKGNPATDPLDVHAVMAFGGAKGSALCAAIELLCGGLVAGCVGTEVQDEYDLVAIVVALDPECFGGLSAIEGASERLKAQVDAARGNARLPGTGAASRRRVAVASGRVEVAEGVLDAMDRIRRGEEPVASNRLTN